MKVGTLDELHAELSRAREKFAPYASAHEGYAVLLEEVDELWEIVRMKKERRPLGKMRREAIQIATVAIRIAEELCPAAPAPPVRRKKK